MEPLDFFALLAALEPVDVTEADLVSDEELEEDPCEPCS